MKKLVSWLLALAMVCSLTACGGQGREHAEMNVYVIAGPTGVGAVNLWARSDAGETENTYHFTMAGSNDEVVAAISRGEADIAAVATNMAAALYQKTQGGVTVLAVNTLGVLSLLTSGEALDSAADLKGRTVYAIGQGANPEYILRYVLGKNGLDPDRDVTLRFAGDAGELMGVWQSEPDAVVMAPQPAATAMLMKYEGSRLCLDMTEEWNRVSGGESTLMMGCVIVRSAFLAEHQGAVDTFLREYAASIEAAQNDTAATAVLCERYGLLPKAALAEQAIPHCGLTFVSGSTMKAQLGGYLQVMFDADAKSVGGKLPDDGFYYGA